MSIPKRLHGSKSSRLITSKCKSQSTTRHIPTMLRAVRIMFLFFPPVAHRNRQRRGTTTNYVISSAWQHICNKSFPTVLIRIFPNIAPRAVCNPRTVRGKPPGGKSRWPPPANARWLDAEKYHPKYKVGNNIQKSYDPDVGMTWLFLFSSSKIHCVVLLPSPLSK